MRLLIRALALAATCIAPLAASAVEPLVRFDGGIGSQPLRASAPGVPAVNDVNGTPPGGRPWLISDLKATVRTDGSITADGRGLILAGGPSTGTSGGVTVRARLFCGGASFDSVDSVQLPPNGDFRIDSLLVGQSGTPPSPCANPVLLIISTGGNWFAAGIPK